jgi:molybdopterin molybdotransferase
MALMISVDEALQALAAATAPLGTERVPLAEAVGRVLAAEVVSDVDWPPFDTSAMDGYAVRLADVAEAGRPIPERASIVAAGDPPPAPLEPGEVVRVMTGAPIPAGTEAIVPVERARRADGRVAFDDSPATGAHIRRRGESIPAGSVLVAAGRRLAPADIALAALAGAEPLEVFRRPRVKVAVSGNELVPNSQKPGPGQLRDSNGPMLASLCRSQGWPAALAPSIADEASSIERLFAEADGREDVLVTSGGVSAGDLDLLPGIARRCGFEFLFHGVAVRPGKPIAVARRGRMLWFGLPGNPVSSAVGFQLFLRFALDRLEGDSAPGATRVLARLARAVKPPGPRESYRDALLTSRAGELAVEPLATRGSHDIAAHARANALLRQKAGSGALSAGEIVECVVIGELGNL